jgi:hypothetical protein
MAAGQGFKTFAVGEVLSAANVNGYLMQGVLVFANAAARTSAITSPQEGQYSYLKDTNSTEYYTGSTWVAIGGGSSPLTTKGDLYTYSTTDTRLPVGTNGYTLVADSSTSTGLAWSAPSGGSITSAVFSNTKSTGTDDGTFTSGAWRTRDLNTTNFNNITSASLASNQITLPAGTYQVIANAPAFRVNNHQARWYNITDNTLVQLGQNAYVASGTLNTTISPVNAVFTIAASKVFELQHRCATTCVNEGFGVNGGWGSEVYSTVQITKVA